MYKAITFDLDDTLWPVAPTIQAAEQALIQFFLTRAPNAGALLQDGEYMRHLRGQLLKAEPQLAIDLATLRKRLIHHVLLDSQSDVAWVEPAFELFFEMRNKVQFYPDTLQALTRLASRYPLFAISNGNADLHKVGLGDYFKGGVSAVHLGFAKPDPKIFQHALGLWELNPSEVLHVGDDPHLDVAAAQNMGMAAIWVNRHAAPWPLAHSVPQEVPDLLALCEGLGC